MTRPVSARALPVITAAFLLVPILSACGGDDPTGSGDSVLGTWEYADSEGQHYFEITESTFRTFHQSLLGADCFTGNEYEIMDVDGTEYTLRPVDDPDSEFTIDMERDGDDLIMLGTSLDRSDVDADDLDECSGLVCGGLQVLTEDDLVSGSISVTDEMNGGGRRFDAYAITGVELPLTLHMTSSEVDSYLYLLDGEGNFLSANDDMDETTLNAFLSFDPIASECYVVVATTAEDNDLGAYILNVEPPI